MASKWIRTKVARKQLGILWFASTAVTFLIMVARSLMGGFADQVIDAWGWYLPMLFPTLGVMLSTFALDLERPQGQKQGFVESSVDTFYFRLTWGLSLFYLVNLLFILIIPADWLASNPNPLRAMALSNLWLGPLQGLTSAALAWFFLNARYAKGGKGS